MKNARIIRVLNRGRTAKIRKLEPRIKVVEKTREPTFSERLEKKVGKLITGSREQPFANISEGAMVGYLAMTLSQINSVRTLHENLRRNLLRLETYIDTEVIQREPRPPVYEDPRLPERDMLRGRLLTIEAERRRLALDEHAKLQPLHEKLWALWQQHSQIKTRWR